MEYPICNSCGMPDTYMSNGDNCICTECGTPDDFTWEEDNMSQIEELYTFKTTDGKLFELERQAKEHQAMLDFKDWYEENKLYGNYDGSVVEVGELLSWLAVNKKVLRTIVNKL